MHSPQSAIPADLSDLLIQRLELIDHIVHGQCRRFRLQTQDAEDLASQVKMKLIENDYAILRNFRGHSRWETFLTTIVRNLCHDFLDHQRGRWRSSVAAQRLGQEAVELEKLWRRDGLTLREAIEQMKRRNGSSLSAQQLLDLAEKLPVRCRRLFLGEEKIHTMVAREAAEWRLERKERSKNLHRLGTLLATALGRLSIEDREVLQMHYGQGLPLATIARRLGVGQRFIYTWHERCLRQLRHFCGGQGISSAAVAQLEGWPHEQLEVDFVRCQVEIV